LQPEDVLCYYLLLACVGGDVVIDRRRCCYQPSGLLPREYVVCCRDKERHGRVAHPTPAPQRKEAFSYIQMTAIKRCHISHCDNHCSHAMSLPKPASRISCCVFQPSQQQRCCVYLTSQASAMTPRLPPLPSPSPSLPSHVTCSTRPTQPTQLVCGGASPVRACIWPHASAVAARSVTRADQRTVVRWAPETLLDDSVEPFLRASNGQTEV